MRTGPTNKITRKLVEDLASQGYSEKSKFLINLSKELNAATRKRTEINLIKLERVCEKGDVIIVPGKVLSYGVLTKPLTVSALNFSEAASVKINKAGGKTMTIRELVEQNPKGTKVRLIK